MKKYLFIVLVIFVFTACSDSSATNDNTTSTENESSTTEENELNEEARTYTDDFGVEVTLPQNPERIVMATWHYPGHLLSLGITPVGVFELAQESEFFGGKLKNATLLTQESVEEILTLEPDLIITDTSNPNIDKLREIAPTIAFDLEKRKNRLETLIDIGEIVGKKAEAEQQIKDWEAKLEEVKQRFEEKFDPEATISVIGDYVSEFYIYGPNFGRGTEVLYTSLELNYPEKLAKEIEESGERYAQLSEEVIPEFVGDYVFISGESPDSATILDDPMYDELPPVKENKVYYIYEPSFYFSDPISLNGQLAYFERILLDGAEE